MDGCVVVFKYKMLLDNLPNLLEITDAGYIIYLDKDRHIK